jgi:hypothetical protein
MMHVILGEAQGADYSAPGAYLAHVHIGEGSKKSKTVQEPQNHGYDHHRVQDRIDRSCHWYKAINKPEENTNHD